jgi:hypothetical protein
VWERQVDHDRRGGMGWVGFLFIYMDVRPGLALAFWLLSA